MKIVACYKLVPVEQDIVVNSNKTLSFDKAEWKIGQYDLNALESAAELKNEKQAEVIGLSAGTMIVDNSKMKKNVLSRGVDSLALVADDTIAQADAYATASVLVGAIKKIGGVDLVLCGEGSGDIYAQQIGPMLGRMLDYTNVNAVKKINWSGDKLLVERDLEDEVEKVEVSLPAVISLTSDINIPRIPTMKEILAASKKPVALWTLGDIGLPLERKVEEVSTKAPNSMERKNIILEGTDEETVNNFFEHLRKIL
jgi:Electron transfer flavoprotein, beta subunit